MEEKKMKTKEMTEAQKKKLNFLKEARKEAEVQNKKIILTTTEREYLKMKIAQKAKTDQEFKTKVDEMVNKKLEEKKDEDDKN